MKHVAKVLTIVLTLALALGMVACGGSHTHTAGTQWENDATNHWHTCTECGEKMDEAAHTKGTQLHFNSDYTTQWYECTVCGYKMDETAHTHTPGTEWKSDGVNHWKECTVCGQKTDEAAHTLGEWQSDGTNHWKECSVCGAEADKAAHTAGEVETDGTTDTVDCTVCGYEMSSTAHQHVLDAWSTNETQHWQVCGTCEQEVNKADHSAGAWTYDADTQKDVQLCTVCGYKMAERTHEHAYTVWTKEGNYDVLSCACGETYEPAVQKIYLDVKYENSIVSVNTSAQAEIDLSAFDASAYTSAMLNTDSVEATFADDTLTMGVAQFELKYGEYTLAVTLKDAAGTDRTVALPVILVTKVFTDKAGFDGMSAIAKECEAERDNFWGGYFELGANITYNAEMANYVYPPNASDSAEGGFCGTFDGCGYTIVGMQINRWTADQPYSRWANCYGVFGKLAGGTVKNVSFTNAKIYMKGSIIANCGTGLIENVYVSFSEITYQVGTGNKVGAFFAFGVEAGATIRHCVVDVTNTVFKDYANNQQVLDEIPADCCLIGTWPIRDGVYIIGAPDTNTYCGEPTPSENDIRGVYESMDAFAAAYNAENSTLKAEISKWDSEYWKITDGAISFVNKG